MSCDPSKICKVCDQRGFALMPVRYAVARKSTLAAPALQAPFGKGLEHAPLPEASASYTLRQMRGGYVYVFNEVRGDWRAYVISEGGYLLEFDIYTRTPPDLTGAKPCARMAKSVSARCIMIPDAIRAGRIWLGFSDVAWTDTVRKLHLTQAHRERHMRCINLGEWARNQIPQPHMDAISNARERVAEYNVPAMPTTPTVGVLAEGYPAYDFSPQTFTNCHAELDDLLEGAKKAHPDVPPAMVALADPVGVALEINALTQTLIHEFESAESRDWHKSTSVMISGLRDAITEESVAKALIDRQNERYAAVDGMRLYPEWDEEMIERNELMFSSLPEGEEQRIRDKAWARYSDNYSEEARLAFEEKLQQDLEQFMRETGTPLVQAFVQWFWSETFREHLQANQDPEHPDSGTPFASIISACLAGLTGHQLVIEKLLVDLSGRYDDIENNILRALVLNNSTVAKKMEEVSTPELTTGNPFAWRQVFNAFEHIASEYSKGHLSGGMAVVAGMAHHVSGAIVTSLGKPVKAGASSVLDFTIRYRMSAILGAVSRKQIIFVSVKASQAQMAHILTEKLAMGQFEVDKTKLRVQVDAALKALEKEPWAKAPTAEKNARKQKIFKWSVMYDDNVSKSLITPDRIKVGEGRASELLLDKDGMRRLINERHSDFGKLIQVDVGFGVVAAILDGWNAYQAIEMVDKEGMTTKSGVNLTAAATSLAGASMELAATVWGKFPSGQMRLATQLTSLIARNTTRAMALGLIGKIFGVLGGLLTAAFDIMSGVEALKKGDIPRAILRFSTGIAGGIMAVMFAVGAIAGGVAVVLFFALAAVSLLGDWVISQVRDDEFESWLGRTPFGIDSEDGFISLRAQDAAIKNALETNGCIK